MGSKLLNAYIIMRINALHIVSAPVLTNTPNFVGMIHLQLFERKGNIEHIVL